MIGRGLGGDGHRLGQKGEDLVESAAPHAGLFHGGCGDLGVRRGPCALVKRHAAIVGVDRCHCSEIEVGFAPLKPAEFVVITITQIIQPGA